MLMSAGLSLPKMVFGHGFLTKVFVVEPIYYLKFLLEDKAIHFLGSVDRPWEVYVRRDMNQLKTQTLSRPELLVFVQYLCL